MLCRHRVFPRKSMPRSDIGPLGAMNERATSGLPSAQWLIVIETLPRDSVLACYWTQAANVLDWCRHHSSFTAARLASDCHRIEHLKVGVFFLFSHAHSGVWGSMDFVAVDLFFSVIETPVILSVRSLLL